jgi:type IV pilus assembly protein PilB
MSNVPEFLASVRLQVPAQTQLINARAELLQDDPMRLLKDLMDKSILPKARLCQLWADSLGVAYVSPMTVAIPTDSYEQLPVEVARRAQAIALNSIGDTVTVAMVEPLNLRQIDSLGKILGKNISPVFSHPEEGQHRGKFADGLRAVARHDRGPRDQKRHGCRRPRRIQGRY